MARLLITAGIILVLVGLAWPLLTRLPLGRLPGDIILRRENFTFYFPLTTCVVVSILLSLVFWLFRKW